MSSRIVDMIRSGTREDLYLAINILIGKGYTSNRIIKFMLSVLPIYIDNSNKYERIHVGVYIKFPRVIGITRLNIINITDPLKEYEVLVWDNVFNKVDDPDWNIVLTWEYNENTQPVYK